MREVRWTFASWLISGSFGRADLMARLLLAFVLFLLLLGGGFLVVRAIIDLARDLRKTMPRHARGTAVDEERSKRKAA